MIYTVECSFADPDREAEWNAFYTFEKLPALISVRGFHTSQRFKAISDGCPVYLALHTLDGLDVLMGEEYHRQGGGNFATWQQHITDWHRNLYTGIDAAPGFNAEERLVLCATGPDALSRMGLEPLAMEAIAHEKLEKSPARRWLAKMPASNAPHVETLPEGVYLYAPISEQLISAHVLSTRSTTANANVAD